MIYLLVNQQELLQSIMVSMILLLTFDRNEKLFSTLQVTFILDLLVNRFLILSTSATFLHLVIFTIPIQVQITFFFVEAISFHLEETSLDHKKCSGEGRQKYKT